METTATARDFNHVDQCHHDLGRLPGVSVGEMKNVLPSRTAVVKTKGRLNFMDLPVELRVKIYENLLISTDELEIPAGVKSPVSTKARGNASFPMNAILQTCKLVNNEATPIFYSKNKFRICLQTEHTRPFFVRNFRWPTLLCISSIKFHSNGYPQQELSLSDDKSPRPCFTCSGSDLVAVLRGAATLYSPICPNNNMALSISSWVSTKVLYVELDAIQKEMEAIISA